MRAPALLTSSLATAVAAAVAVPWEWGCPPAAVNPATAVGWGYWSSLPPPGDDAVWPTAGISSNTFFISSVRTTGSLQQWCASSATVVAGGDGTELFSVPATPPAYVGCGLMQTIASSPVVKNVSFALGGPAGCPTSVADNSSPIFRYQVTSEPTPQGLVCPTHGPRGTIPPVMLGAGDDQRAPLARFAVGVNNLTFGTYGWMHQVLCVLNVTRLPGVAGGFQVWTGGVVNGVDVPSQCTWLRYDTAAATVTREQGPLLAAAVAAARGVLGGATLVAAAAPACPTSFSGNDVIRGWTSGGTE